MSATAIGAARDARREADTVTAEKWQPARAREVVLDAAKELARSRAWSEITITDIAREAGVKRGQVYKSFASRRELGQALIRRESAGLFDDLRSALDARVEDPPGAMQAAFDLFLTATRQSPLIGQLLRGDSPELLGGPALGEIYRLRRATRQIAGLISETWPLSTRGEANLLGEVLVRLAVSHALQPGRGEPDETSPAAALAPYLERTIRTERAADPRASAPEAAAAARKPSSRGGPQHIERSRG